MKNSKTTLIDYVNKCYDEAKAEPDYILSCREQAFGALQFYLTDKGYDDALADWWNCDGGMLDKFNELIYKKRGI